MKKYLKLAGLFTLGLIFFVSCKKDTPAPTASFTAVVVGNVVTLTAEATDYSKYEWDFGDGSYISTIHTPVHIYSSYGRDFTVTLTIKGPGGEVTVANKVTIPPKTKLQLLTGGTGTSSRKWRLNSNSPTFTIAAANAALSQMASYPGGILANIGMSKVYSDEFVFKADGTLTINSKGGGIFAGYYYCALNGKATSVVYAPIGLAYTAAFTTPAGATFAINENKNYTISTPAGDVTYPGVMTLSFTKGGFLGLMDFTSECIITSLTDASMSAILFYSAVATGKPTYALQVTFEVAP
jgi:hypothetical protein